MFLTMFIPCFNSFIEMFCLQPSRYLRLSMVQQALLRLPRIRSRWFLLSRSEIYILPSHKKCNRTTNYTYSILSIAFVTEWTSIACKTSDFPFLLLSLVNYPPSTTTLRFPYSSSMNICLGKSIKFPIQSISIPSCSSWTVLTLFEDFPLHWKRDFLQK